MRSLWTAALILTSAASSTSSAVLQLAADEFQAHLKSHSPVLVNFCLPWYMPCQQLEPEFETAAEVLKKRDITFVSIDCSVHNTTCIANKITSYPTIRLFHGLEKFTRYRHERKATSIISFMIRQNLPLVSEVDSQNVKELLSMGTTALIAYIDEDDETSRSAFSSFATSRENDFIYGISSDLTLAKSDARKPPFIVLYNPLSQANPIFQQTFMVSEIEAFTKKYSTPLIGTFSLETYYKYTEEGTPLAHIFVSFPSEQSALVSLLKPVAEKFKGKLNFATIDATKYGFFAKVLNLVPDRFPAFVIEDTVTGDAAPFDQNEKITAEKIENFIERVFRDRNKIPEQTAAPILTRDEL